MQHNTANYGSLGLKWMHKVFKMQVICRTTAVMAVISQAALMSFSIISSGTTGTV